MAKKLFKKRHIGRTARHTVIAAMCIALGIVLPLFFHAVGLGSMFLPIHISVLIAAFILPFKWAVAVALLTPIVSSLATGMPPLFPVLPLMLFELVAYTFFVWLFSRRLKLNTHFSLVLSQGLGRGVLALAAVILEKLSPNFVMSAYFTATVLPGLVGAVLQLVIIPPIVLALKRSMGYPADNLKVATIEKKSFRQRRVKGDTVGK